MKMDVKAMGLSLGILWGGSVMIMGLIAIGAPNYAGDFVAALASKYPGYAPTVIGSLKGFLCGFIDAGIGGLILAWLYNKFSK
jgi:hypothetical protein